MGPIMGGATSRMLRTAATSGSVTQDEEQAPEQRQPQRRGRREQPQRGQRQQRRPRTVMEDHL